MKGLDLRRFKKVHSDEHCSTFRDSAGHELKVAHKPLTAARRKQLDAIPTYADGGEVKEEKSGWDDFTKDFGEASKQVFGEEAPPQQSGIDFASRYNAPPEPVRNVAESDKKLSISPEERAGLDAVRASEGPLPTDSDQPITGPSPASLSEATLAPAPSAPVQSFPGMDPNQMVNQYTAGVNQEAQALGQQGRQEANILGEQVNAQQKLMNDWQQHSQNLMGEVDALMKDYRAQHINPKHYMENMSSGQKVMTAIGLLMGGMGSGLAGGENPAAKFLDDQIARDIKAQEANLGKTENLLSFNMKQFGNLKDALTMTEAMQKGLYAAKIEQAAAMSKDPIAKARGMQMAAKFKAEILPNITKLAQGQVNQRVLSDPNASPMTKVMALPQGIRDNALKELGEYSEIKTNLSQVGPVMREAFKNTTMGEKTLNPIQAEQRKKVAFAQLFPIAKSIAGERMTDADARALIEPYLPSMTTNKQTLEQNIKKLEEQLLAKAKGKTPILSEYGIVPQLKGAPRYKTVKGVKYMEGPNGEAIPVK